jgi:hypothetical protein
MSLRFSRCPEKEKLQRDLDAAVLKLSGAIPLLADTVDAHIDFQQTKRHCEIVRADILELKQKIARHQEEHGC